MPKGLMMIIGKPKAKYGEGSDDSEEETASESPSLTGMASKKAAKGVLAAVESGDVAALDRALKAHYEACQGE